MRYFVVDKATGCMDEIPSHETIESARADKASAEAQTGMEFVIVDENGKVVESDD